MLRPTEKMVNVAADLKNMKIQTVFQKAKKTQKTQWVFQKAKKAMDKVKEKDKVKVKVKDMVI